MKRKKKILWICTFTNEEKRSHLDLWRTRRGEVGQWIPNLIKGFIGDSCYEIHVVSAQLWMRHTRQSWTQDGITYHCFQPGIPGIGYSFRTPFEAWTRYFFNRQHIRKIIAEVKPDLIHLFGAENASYASAILDVDPKTPVLVLIQGFIHRDRQPGFNARSRCYYEGLIIKHCNHYIGDYESEHVVKQMNPKASWRHFYLPVNEALIVRTPECEKKYDILFAGGMTAVKGFPDFLELVRMLREKFPTLKAGVVGKMEHFPPAQAFVETHRLEHTIDWLGRFPNQEGLFKAYRQSRLFIAPTYNDAFASTIRECMLLGTPVIAYRTGGIPYANRDGNENVVIVPQGDIDGMVTCCDVLLTDIPRREALAAQAKAFAEREFSLDTNTAIVRKAYQDMLE